MRSSVNPVVAGIVIIVVLVVVGVFLWRQTAGTTFTKSEARGGRGLPSLGGQ